MKKIDEDLIRGGCGHSAEEIRSDVNAYMWFVKIMLVVGSAAVIYSFFAG